MTSSTENDRLFHKLNTFESNCKGLLTMCPVPSALLARILSDLIQLASEIDPNYCDAIIEWNHKISTLLQEFSRIINPNYKPIKLELSDDTNMEGPLDLSVNSTTHVFVPFGGSNANSTKTVPKRLRNKSKMYTCKQKQCSDKRFTRKATLRQHEHSVHLHLRPFRCLWDGCTYKATQRGHGIYHIRTVHLRLPKTAKRQLELNIEDSRDPKQYLAVDSINEIAQGEHNTK